MDQRASRVAIKPHRHSPLLLAGHRSRLAIVVVAVAACRSAASPQAPAFESIYDRVTADFEKAVLASKDAYVGLFDFAAVGEIEILLHRYDLMDRLPGAFKNGMDRKDQFLKEDGTPYPPERERRNVGNFYPQFVQRTVGTGGCIAGPPRTRYARLLGTYFEDDLPDDTPAGYAILREHANAWWRRGGVVGITCRGGKGGIAVVWTKTTAARGYDLITIYDD
jgi:hypothetical protein